MVCYDVNLFIKARGIIDKILLGELLVLDNPIQYEVLKSEQGKKLFESLERNIEFVIKQSDLVQNEIKILASPSNLIKISKNLKIFAASSSIIVNFIFLYYVIFCFRKKFLLIKKI